MKILQTTVDIKFCILIRECIEYADDFTESVLQKNPEFKDDTRDSYLRSMAAIHYFAKQSKADPAETLRAMFDFDFNGQPSNPPYTDEDVIKALGEHDVSRSTLPF